MTKTRVSIDLTDNEVRALQAVSKDWGVTFEGAIRELLFNDTDVRGHLAPANQEQTS